MMPRRSGQSGFGLILLVTFIATAALFVSGAAIFLTNSIRQTQLETDKLKAYDLAQAGVKQALHDWWTSSSNEASRRYAPLEIAVSGVDKFRTGTQADFAYFMFNSPANAHWTNNARQFRAWTVRNNRVSISGNSDNITVVGAVVSWDPAGAGTLRLTRIRLNNQTVFNGSAVNGSTISLSGSANSRTLTPGATWNGNNTRFEWNQAMPSPVRLTVRWIFSDDSATLPSRSHEVLCWNGAHANQGTATAARPAAHTFSVLATGQVAETAGLPKVLQTVRATVSGNATPGPRMEIIDWRKVEKGLA